MVLINGRGLCHEPDPLLAVLLDVLLGAGIYQVDLEVGKVVAVGVVDLAAVCQIPVVDVVGAEIFQCSKACGGNGKIIVRAGKRRPFEDQKRWL